MNHLNGSSGWKQWPVQRGAERGVSFGQNVKEGPTRLGSRLDLEETVEDICKN